MVEAMWSVYLSVRLRHAPSPCLCVRTAAAMESPGSCFLKALRAVAWQRGWEKSSLHLCPLHVHVLLGHGLSDSCHPQR